MSEQDKSKTQGRGRRSQQDSPAAVDPASPGEGKDAAEPEDPKATSATQDGALPDPDATTPPQTTGEGNKGSDGDDDALVAPRRRNEPQNGAPDTSGPGTGTPAAPESTYRMPSTIVTDPEGAPLDPPSDTPTQVDPRHGYSLSSTDKVWAESGGHTVAGEDHIRLVDGDGNDVDLDSLFDDSNATKTTVTSTKRVYEEFYYPGTTEKCLRLLFAAGAVVPRARAVRIIEAAKDSPTPAVEARA